MRKLNLIIPRGIRFEFIILFILMIIAALFEMIGIGIIPAYVVLIMDTDKIFNLINDLNLPFNLDTYLSSYRDSLVLIGSAFLALIYILKNIYLMFFFYYQGKVLKKINIFLSTRLFKVYLYSNYYLVTDWYRSPIITFLNHFDVYFE